MTGGWVALIATVFGVGRLRPASGTWGSAAGLLLAAPVVWIGGAVALGLALTAVTVIGAAAADRYARDTRKTDPSEVVIDEVAGLWLTLLFVRAAPLDWALAFAAFRLFDISKPWPISWADRHVKGGAGIMLDDLFAGLMAGAGLIALRTVIP